MLMSASPSTLYDHAAHAYENDTFGDDTLITWGWIYGRDISYGRPAHTWQPLTDTEPEIYAGGAALASYGLIANIDNSEGKIPDSELYDRVYKNFSARITEPLNGEHSVSRAGRDFYYYCERKLSAPT
jgi:hypothetical protein